MSRKDGSLRSTAEQNLLHTWGGEPIYSKFACILKSKADGTIKRRIISDSKQSSVTDASRKMYKAVPPRATDLVTDMRSMLALSDSHTDVEVFICDAVMLFGKCHSIRPSDAFTAPCSTGPTVPHST